jgi:hypothetical protein
MGDAAMSMAYRATHPGTPRRQGGTEDGEAARQQHEDCPLGEHQIAEATLAETRLQEANGDDMHDSVLLEAAAGTRGSVGSPYGPISLAI